MTTDNHRKAEQSKAKTEESGESLVSLSNSVMVDKAERKTSILPSDHDTYIATIEGVLDDLNIQGKREMNPSFSAWQLVVF